VDTVGVAPAGAISGAIGIAVTEFRTEIPIFAGGAGGTTDTRLGAALWGLG
jgi:hypothetical protein